MKNIKNSEELKNAIINLEARVKASEIVLQSQLHTTLETFKPSNILKNTISEVAASPQFKHNILNLALGLGAGLITNKIAVGKKAGLLARTVGTALQFGITSLIVKNKANEEKVGQKRGSLLKRIFSRSTT